MEYRVELDVYNGPMDLLLYLIKRDELDVYDIPIASITTSYMQYVTMLHGMNKEGGLDINVAGEFLVMAATLMEIKSALLLPHLTENPTDPNAPTTTEDITDPRYELVQKLLEYKRFKDSAMLLEQKAMLHAQRFPRYPALPDTPADEMPPLDMEEVQIWDLLEAFNRLMQEVGLRKEFHDVVYDDTPFDLYAADIEDRLARDGRLSLRQLIIGKRTKGEMIGVFLAILELTRQKRILVTQDQANDDLEIVAASEEHRQTYHEGMVDAPADEEARPAEPTLFDAAEQEEAIEPEGTHTASILEEVQEVQEREESEDEKAESGGSGIEL